MMNAIAEFHRIAAVIPAAGASSRMRGDDKLLFRVGGMPILRKIVVEALHSRASEVVVAVHPKQNQRKSALAGLDIVIAETERSELGMAESLKSGLANISPDCAGAIILLPDMPLVQTRHINSLIGRFEPGKIIMACGKKARNGNPVIVPGCLFAELQLLSGDTGARGAIGSSGLETVLVELPGITSQLDLDAMEEWTAWRRGEVGNSGAGGGN